MIELITTGLAVIILSGIISGTEAALLSLTFAKARELATTSKSGKYILIIKENIRKYISLIVILNNVVNIVGSMYIGLLTIKILGNEYMAIVSAIITFLIIIFSEIIPKNIGQTHSATITKIIAKPLYLILIPFYPIIILITKFSEIFVKNNDIHVSEGEIRELAILGNELGSIDEHEMEVIENIFEMDTKTAYEIMVPKHKMIVLEENMTYLQVLKIFKKHNFGKYPVINSDSEIIGIVNIKDIIGIRPTKFSLKKYIRKVLFVSEETVLQNILEDFKSNKTHTAIVLNEFGNYSGMITLEDILEELIGDVDDEFEAEDEELKKISKKKYECSSDLEISKVNEKLKLNIENEDYKTINGLFINKLKRIPKTDDLIKINKVKFKVKTATKKKAKLVEIILP